MKAKLKWDIEAIWSVFLLFIFSETLHLSDGDTALNFITVFVVSCLPVRLQGAYFDLFFQVTSFPSTSVAWLDACVPQPNNCWGRVLFLSVNPSGRRRGMWRWVTANIRVPAPCHTCIQRGRIIFKACRLQHVIRLRAQNKNWKKKEMADILHSWAHSTKYNNFLEFFDPRRRSQGTSCCPCSTSCSCSSIRLLCCHGHWKTV